jgi:hypothetical protein
MRVLSCRHYPGSAHPLWHDAYRIAIVLLALIVFGVLNVGLLGFITTRGSIESIPVWLHDSFTGQPSVWCVPEGQQARFWNYVDGSNLLRDFGQAGLSSECYDTDVPITQTVREDARLHGDYGTFEYQSTRWPRRMARLHSQTQP